MSEEESSSSKLSKLAFILGFRFLQRWDIHAIQLENGRYICEHKPVDIQHIFAHLKGEITLGAYLLDEKSLARYIVFDTDDQQGFSRLSTLAEQLSIDDIPSYLEKSRRGGHLWLFFSRSIAGSVARAFGMNILNTYSFENVELFPKQDVLGDGPGSLIRMPFGVHRVSGQRYGFFHPDGQLLAPSIREQISEFEAPEMVPEALIQSIQHGCTANEDKTSQRQTPRGRGDIVDQIKTSVSVVEFIGQYIDLKITSSGAIGLCPFHDDHHPSFSINSKGNYWQCFAGCGGGSIVDFWMKWRDCEFLTAIKELSGLLL